MRCVTSLLNIGTLPDYEMFAQTFTEINNLEVNKEEVVDPKGRFKAIEILTKFFDPEVLNLMNKGHEQEKRTFLKALLNQQDVQGYTALHLASFYGQYELVNKFLFLKASTKLKDHVHNKEPIEYSRNKCIMKAIRDINDSVLDNDMNKFDFLLNSGFSIENAKCIHIRRPMHNAVYNAVDQTAKSAGKGKEEEFLKTVIKCGAEIDSTDSDGWTPLHHACKLGVPEPVMTLLNNQANLNIFSNKGYYPLHVAAMENHIEVINILVQRGADVNVSAR